MKIDAKIDRPRLERSLKRHAKDFGDTNAQAICRWGVQVCRELAVETHAWKGRAGTPLKVQQSAIISDAYNVLLVVERIRPTPKGYRVENQGKTYYVRADRVCKTAQEASDWIEINRTRRRRRTAKLPIEEKKVVKVQDFKKAVRLRNANAGMAKGGWLGAGMRIASEQKGAQKISIGKNFLSYAQKHSKFGSAQPPKSGFSSSAKVTNRAQHSGDPYVLSKRATRKAIDFGLRKTVRWYASAMRAQDKKQKP